MRSYGATMLVVLATCALSRALADPPATSVTPKPQDASAQDVATQDAAAQDSAAKDRTTQSSASKAASATAAPTSGEAPRVSSAKSVPGAPNERMEEKVLRDQGYKPTMKNGERLYCKSERPTGSNLPSTHCLTVAEAEALSKNAKESTERIQHSKGGCLGTGNAHVAPNCGN